MKPLSRLWSRAGRHPAKLVAVAAAVVVCTATPAALLAQTGSRPGTVAGPTSPPNHPGLTEEVTFLTIRGLAGTYQLEALIVREAKATGRLPIALLTHGKPRFAADMAKTSAALMAWQARDLAYRGYLAVAVVRRGYGRSDGTPGKATNAPYAVCNLADLQRYFLVESDDLDGALRTIAQRPDADGTRAIAIGASVGGGAVLALAARNPPGLAAAVNVAGAMRITDAQGALLCPHDLPIAALASFGGNTKTPTLWVYSENDSFFPPDIARKLHAAYVAQGGVATLRIVPPLREDGHYVFERLAGREHWLAALDPFLQTQGLPTWTAQQVDTIMRTANIPANRRQTVEAYLSLYTPKVLVQAPNGVMIGNGDTRGLEPARTDALAACQKSTGTPCKVIMENFDMAGALTSPAAAPVASPAAPITAQAATVAAVFEKLNLLGTFALDCTQPVGVHNHYIVHRALDTGTVERELLIGPARRQYGYIIDRAEELRPREVDTSMSDGRRRLNMVFRVDSKRMRTVESGPESGPKVISGGNFISGGVAPWYNKC